MANSRKNNDHTVWFACGENCMPINVLRRHNKIAPSTPFSAGRSDIEHLEYFEKTNFDELMNINYLIEANAFSGKCWLNIAKKSRGIFRPGRHQYVEFTHHNPVNVEDQKIISRRIKRMIDARKTEDNKVLFYNHRSNTGFLRTKAIIKQSAKNILDMYNGKTHFVCYSQTIVKTKEERGLEMISTYNKKIIFFNFKTLHLWSGNNKDIFFGKNDDDLFRIMFNEYSKHYN